MCGPSLPPLVPANNSRFTNTFGRWAATALCVTAIFYQRRGCGTIICTECYHSNANADRETYQLTIRHYIHVGYGFGFEECSNCAVVITVERRLEVCLVCRPTFNDFVQQLPYAAGNPVNSREPTIIAISQTRF